MITLPDSVAPSLASPFSSYWCACQIMPDEGELVIVCTQKNGQFKASRYGDNWMIGFDDYSRTYTLGLAIKDNDWWRYM